MSNVTSADLCFSARRPRSLNDQINVPFYIYAPNYRDSSGGIRVLHYLCHILNEMGEEAYLINTQINSPRLRTPLLTLSKMREHFLSGRNPVTIYPEVVSNNPANTPLIARWLLNIPGHLGKPIEFEPKDLLLYYEAWCLPENISGLPLFIHPVDHNVFNNDNNPDNDNRTLECYYAHKYHLGKDKVLADHQELISLGQEIKRTHREIADILRKAKVLYCYEPSGIISEAQACGCPVLFVRSKYWPLPPDDTHHAIPGAAVFGTRNALARARKTLARIPTVHGMARDNSWIMTKAVAERVYLAADELLADGKPLKNEAQTLWSLSLESRCEAVDKFCDIYAESGIYFSDINPESGQRSYSYNNDAKMVQTFSDTAYQKWLTQRMFIETDTRFLDFGSSERREPLPSFHLIIRLPQGFETQLADTLDSLGLQIHENWRLDIVSPLPSPEYLEEIPNIGWHTLDSTHDYKKTIDIIAKASPLDWLIELPPGAKLDILYLWRLAAEILSTPEKNALFVDDDCCDENNHRHSPRFKPGTNPGHLQASDLAGPICVRKAAWITSGGAGQDIGSPWYDQLLRIAGNFSWETIKHVPDILITYTGNFPSSPSSCQVSLRNSLQTRHIEGEIKDITEQSWDIHYALSDMPAVTIAILAQGQLEYISRCLDSVIAKTRYPAFEVLIVTNELPDCPETDQWLMQTTAESCSPVIRFTYAKTDANHASRCNTAIASTENDLIVLVREETVFVQEIWLEELVRTCQQPEVGAASPLVHQAGDAKILTSGNVLGLFSDIASPYSSKAPLGSAGYLDCLLVTRDVSTLPSSCLIVRRDVYLEVGGMDDAHLGDHYAEVDLCLKVREQGQRLVVTPRSSVVYGGDTSQYDQKRRLEISISKMDATKSFRQRWGKNSIVDPYWNPNLSLSNVIPHPETEFRAQWQYLPCNKPRILAHPLGNGQGDFRIIAPLSAARKAGLATECIWRQHIVGMARFFTAAEIARLEPTSLIVQNYIHDFSLAVLDEWNTSSCRPFLVYALDDLINDLDKSNPFRKHIPPNARSRLKYALARCDRLVVSTDFLAETYRHFIGDIRVVPNRLEKDIWCPLKSLKRTGNRPRIGWAGGSTHQGDLLLLKEIIEKTRDEADWIFFGMCPDEIRPLLAEYHDLVPFHEYPAYIASLNLDIAVAPLTMTPFNQGKSNLRLLEYGALGIPVVCTDIDPYRNSPACRVENSAKTWIAALRERIYDADAREREGAAMREWVHQHYLLENHLEEWLYAHLPDPNNKNAINSNFS